MPDATDRTPPFRDTPLDPRFKKGFYLDAGVIAGRVRARTEGIPNKQIDFLALNERGELLVSFPQEVVDLLTSLNETADKVLAELMRIR